jgi:hypothetical protein
MIDPQTDRGFVENDLEYIVRPLRGRKIFLTAIPATKL